MLLKFKLTEKWEYYQTAGDYNNYIMLHEVQLHFSSKKSVW